MGWSYKLKQEYYMIERTRFEINPKKYEDFREFIKNNAKDKKFWEENKKIAETNIDQKELDILFKD